MNKPLFDLDQTNMQVEVNSYKPGSGLVWPILFPLKFTPKFDLKGIEGDEGIPVSADRVAFNVKAPLKTRKTVGQWSGKLSKIAISREKNELEINEYLDLQVIANANTDDKATARYLVDMVYDDVKFCNDGIDYKNEIDAMRIGSHGVQTFPANIEGDMATEDIINFNIPSSNFRYMSAATKKWSASATADGIKDLRDGQKAIADKGLRKPMWAIMESKAFDYLCSQTSTQKRLFPAAYTAQTVTADMIDLTAINKYMNSKGWPQILVIDSYSTIESKDGSQTTMKPWAENVVALSPVPQLGYTYYKPVPIVKDTDAVQAQGAYAKTTVYSEVNPMLEVTMAEAYLQCGLINRASLVFVNTENTSWDSGNVAVAASGS